MRSAGGPCSSSRAWSGSRRWACCTSPTRSRCSPRVTLLQGVYRALDSGPLESWYVDTTLAAEPDAGIEHGLSAGATVLSVAIALGALALRRASSRSIRSTPSRPWPCRSSSRSALGIVNLIAILVLMDEHRACPRCRGRGGLDPGRPTRHRRRPGAPAHVPRAARPRRRGAVLGLRDGHLREPVPDPPVRDARQHRPGGGGDGSGQLGRLVRGGRRRGRGRAAQRSDRRRALGRAAADRPGRDDRGDGPASPGRSGRSSPISPATWPTGRRTRCTRPCSTARWMGRTGPRSCR